MKCPGCNNKLDDQTSICPLCGRILNNVSTANKKSFKDKLALKRFSVLAIIIILPLTITVVSILGLITTLGVIYLSSDDVIINNCKKELANSPDNIDTNKRLADSYKRIGEYNLAIKYYEIANKLGYKSAKMFENMAECYYSIDNYENTIEYAQKALKLNPDLFEAHYLWGNGLYYQNKKKEALEVYNKALKLKPKTLSTQYLNWSNI